MAMPETASREPVLLLDAVRTPFIRAGTDFLPLESVDLARAALAGTLSRTGVPPDAVDAIIMGTVVQNIATSNVARDAGVGAGIKAPGHTVSMACISSSRAIADGALEIAAGHAGMVIAGGVELLSDIPPVFSKDVRQRLFRARKEGFFRSFRGVKPAQVLPGAPRIGEYTTGETMGHAADRLAARFGISREEQDAFALRSHSLAAGARTALGRQLVPVLAGGKVVLQDNSVRDDTSLERLARLDPVFVKPFGTVTAGNASPLTDGAAAVMLADAATAGRLGLKPRAVIRDFVFTAHDPASNLLLGPAWAIPRLLQRNGVTWQDLSVIELHEAFAGQLLGVLAALSSAEFGRSELGLDGAFADVSLDRVNLWGGSIALGHPFGATGARLVQTAMDRLEAEDGELALVAACAAGGQAHAMLIGRSAA